ncbi:MAG: DUF5017 domain-containing protein [Tannerella sp.]|nr:DUF5017 domain-containing protein [Tannerella sp.]
MKNIHIIILIVLSGVFCSCEEEVIAPDFNVTVEAVTKSLAAPAAVGQDSITIYDVTYRFSGAPESIVMYSGEPGKEYANRNRYTKNVKSTVQFSTDFSDGDLSNTLRVFISTDFVPFSKYSGQTVTLAYAKEGVADARWTDITNRFVLPGNALATGVTPAGEVDISSYLSDDNPVFLAFRYDVTRSSGLSNGKWIISNFKLANYDPNDNSKSELYSDKLNANWLPVNMIEGDSTQWIRSEINATANTTASVDGNFSAAPAAQIYLISRAFYPNRVIPDKGQTVKLISEIRDEYTYRYTNPQTNYKATFIATNTRGNENIQVVKEIELKFD